MNKKTTQQPDKFDPLSIGLAIGIPTVLNWLFDDDTTTTQAPTMTPEQKQAYTWLLKRIYGMMPASGQNPPGQQPSAPPAYNPNKNPFTNMPDDEFSRVAGNVRFGGNQVSKKYFGGR